MVDTIYFDFAKAFDTVPHRRLKQKLQGHGITGRILGRISSFLCERKQLVKVNNAKSNFKDIISGIPQGSVLGPLLFVIYINDLPDDVLSEIAVFADDTKIFREVNTVYVSEAIQADSDILEVRSKKWLLRFYPDKCRVLTLGKFADIKHAHRYSL